MKKFERGITLVEIMVVVFIIALFTVILVSDFPRMLRQMALSRVSYSFAQNLRKAQDLGLSGIQLYDVKGAPIEVKGYGVYINLNAPKQYIIYADVAGAPAPVTGLRTSDNKYNGPPSYPLCSEVDQTVPSSGFVDAGILIADCAVEIISVTKEDQSLYISELKNLTDTSHVSINFSPPGPITTIENLDIPGGQVRVRVYFKNSDGGERIVLVYRSGLIDVQ
jgi:type II secretory pathway pseudopilin PulG